MTTDPASTRPRDDRLPPGGGGAADRRWSGRIVPAMLVFVAIVPLLPTLRAGFVYDDTTIIRDNVLLRGWSALARVWSAPYWPTDGADVSGLYRPFHVALLAVVWNIGDGAPRVFHLYALLLHAVATLLVWWLLRAGVGRTAAAVAAAWFATQPLHVEAVASVANSAELLVVSCTIGLVALLRRVDGDRAPIARQWLFASLAALLTLAAVWSKESGLMALPLAALTAWGWGQRNSRTATEGARFVRQRSRILLAGGAALIIGLLVRTAVLGGAVTRVSIAAPGLDSLAPMERVAAMLSLWPRIGGMLVWPTALSPYYGPTLLPPHRGALAIAAAIAMLGLCALVVALARRGDARPLVAVGWAALTHRPASNLFSATGQLLADRTLFGASVGAALGIGWIIDRVPRRARWGLLAVCALLIGRNAFESAKYAVAWSSHRTLWERLVETSPAEYRGYQLLGIDARERGDSARALPLLARAFVMEPRDRRVRFEYGQVLYTTGRHAAAARVLAPLLRDGDVRREPGFVAMYLDAVGRSAGAEGVVSAGTPLLRTEAAVIAALYVGAASEQLGKLEAADSAYRAALRLQPTDTILLARRRSLERRITPR